MTSFQYIKALPGVLEIGWISPVFQGTRPLGAGERSRKPTPARQENLPAASLEISGNLTVFGLQQSPGLR